MEDVRVLRVNTTVDEFDSGSSEGNGLSLREAIAIANQSAGDDIIELESNAVYELSIVGVDGRGTRNPISQGDLDIGSTGGKLTIRGLGEGATVDANQINRVFHVRDDNGDNGATLVLENITVTGGRARQEGFGLENRNGGGILIDNAARATLIDSTVTGNVTSSNDYSGGGISNEGNLTIRNSVISDNVAGNGGGIYTHYGVTTIVDSTITRNTANDTVTRYDIGRGGGVAHVGAGNTEIINTSILDNSSNDSGGGVHIREGNGSSRRKGSLNIEDSIISGNSADSDEQTTGGGVESNVVESVVIENTVIENNTADFGAGIRHRGGYQSGRMVVTGSTIRNNIARFDGGGILSNDDLTIRNSTISGNRANDSGGAVYSNLGSIRIYDSTVDNNSAGRNGGGLYEVNLVRGTTISNNSAGGDGGGFHGKIGIILDSTISGNSADGNGGGVFSSASIFEPVTIAMGNTTIAGNSAKEYGGGIYVVNGLLEASGVMSLFRPTLTANNLTVTDNLADSDNDGSGSGGGIYTPSFFVYNNGDTLIPGDVTFNNSILTDNFDTPENSGEGTINPNISGPARGNGNNLVGDLTGLVIDETSGAPEATSLGRGSDITGVDPLLGELQDNGSGILTYALLPGSPAINAGSNENIFPEIIGDINGDGEPATWDLNGDGDVDDFIEFDQRGEGYSRIFDGTVDIGAFELQEVVDNAPTVVVPIDDFSVTENGEDRTIDLSNVFEDRDDDDITVTVASNSNDELVAATVEDNNLVLDFTEDTSGTAEITLRATANGQTVDDTFSITVNEEDTEQPPEEPEEPEEQTIELFRFRNTTFSTGTYIFVGEAERDFILDDENLSNTFSLDGQAEDGTMNPAFTASSVDGEGLIPFYRLESTTVGGTFVFVSTAEYDAIFAEDSNQSEQWKKQGFADEAQTQDVPEFYLRDGSADSGVVFNRFQNQENGTFLYAGGAEIDAIEDNPDLNSLFKNQGVAFKSM